MLTFSPLSSASVNFSFVCFHLHRRSWVGTTKTTRPVGTPLITHTHVYFGIYLSWCVEPNTHHSTFSTTTPINKAYIETDKTFESCHMKRVTHLSSVRKWKQEKSIWKRIIKRAFNEAGEEHIPTAAILACHNQTHGVITIVASLKALFLVLFQNRGPFFPLILCLHMTTNSTCVLVSPEHLFCTLVERWDSFYRVFKHVYDALTSYIKYIGCR